MIPQETVQLILDTAQVADVVGDYVTLKRRGASYVACCPFHNEKTPSFYVTPSKGIYKCFGCGKSGTAVGFVMEQEQCTYPDALRILARRYNIDIIEQQESAEDIASRQRTESLMIVCDFAQKFFASQLASGEGKDVGYAYFRSRGLEDETIAGFGLGWAPSSRTALIDAAREAGYNTEYLLEAGLAVKNDDGSVIDKFRARAMFPIHTVSGRTIAFSGRTLRSDNPAKYVNSPETEIYKKSRVLYDICKAKADMHRLDNCILVEGNVDMVMMHQLGIRNVVASCGTALTVEQIRLIRRFTSNLTIMYDGDSAGIHAALKGIDRVLPEGINLKIVLLPDGEDPDSFGRKHTLQEFQDFIESEKKDFIAFKSDLLISDAAGDPLKKAMLINDIADTIALIPDPVIRSTYVDSTAIKFGIEPAILFDRIRKDRQKMQEDAAREQERKSRSEVVEAQDYPSPEVQGFADESPRQSNFENPLLAPYEADLLGFMLNYGCDILEFETDSEFYSSDDKQTVADFIRNAIQSDGSTFCNSSYRKLFDDYYALYDQGLEAERILKSLYDASDRTEAAIAASVSEQKYEITYNKFQKSLTTSQQWLVNQVPKAIIIYQERRLESQVARIREELKKAEPGTEMPLLQSMKEIQTLQRKLRLMTGREKILK